MEFFVVNCDISWIMMILFIHKPLLQLVGTFCLSLFCAGILAFLP